MLARTAFILSIGLTIQAATQESKPALAGAATAKTTEPAKAAEATAALESSKKVIAGFAVAEFTIDNAKKAGASDDYVASFKANLAKRLAERKHTETLAKGRLEIRLDKVVVVSNFKRSMMGVLAPPDLFAATVRVLDEKGQEAALVTIPETKVMASTFGTNWDKLLGLEGAALVYKTLFAEK